MRQAVAAAEALPADRDEAIALASAVVALAEAAGDTECVRRVLANARARLADAPAPDAASWAWLRRAGIAASAPPGGMRQIGPDGAWDEIGGFTLAGAEPTTEATAVAGLATLAAKPVGRTHAIGAAARFCGTMVYNQPAEAWFADAPAELLGAVRVRPRAAEDSLAAAAAALELLTRVAR